MNSTPYVNSGTGIRSMWKQWGVMGKVIDWEQHMAPASGSLLLHYVPLGPSQSSYNSTNIYLFFLFLFLNLFLFIYGCVGSSFLCEGFL